LKSQDENVKREAIASLAEFSQIDPQKIKKIALSMDIGNNFSFANALFKLFFSTSVRPITELTRSEIQKMMMKLKTIESLEHRSDGSGFYICNFFKYACEKNPDSVIKLFFERIKFAHEINKGKIWNRHDPIPSRLSYHCLETFINHRDHLKLLKKVRNAALTSKNIYHFRDLFSILSNNYQIDSLSVFTDWIRLKDEDKLLLICKLLVECHN
jgi:hypothetical protein